MNSKRFNKLVELDKKYQWKYYSPMYDKEYRKDKLWLKESIEIEFGLFDQIVLFILAPPLSFIFNIHGKISKKLRKLTIVSGEI